MKEIVVKDKNGNSLTIFVLNGFNYTTPGWMPAGKELETIHFPPADQFYEDDVLLCSYPRSEIFSMKEIVVNDKNGNSLTIFVLKGFNYATPGWVPKAKELETINFPPADQFYEDDVLLCSYPRSGYHWTWECLNMLTHNTTKVSNLNVVETNIESSVVLNSSTGFEQKRPRILHTHLPIQLIPDYLLKKKVVLLYRNPKDLAYSWYGLIRDTLSYNGSFDDFMELFLDGNVPYGSWFDYMTEFEKYIEKYNICVTQFEERVEDPVANLRKLAEYLGVNVSDDFLMKVSAGTNIKIMAREKPQYGLAKEDRSDDVLEKRGKVGGWKEHFTMALNEKFDNVYREKMRNLKLKITFSL